MNCKGYRLLDVSDAITQHGFMKQNEIFVLIAHCLRIHSNAQSWQTSRPTTLTWRIWVRVAQLLIQQSHFIKGLCKETSIGSVQLTASASVFNITGAPAVTNVIVHWFAMCPSSLFSIEFEKAISWRSYEKRIYHMKSGHIIKYWNNLWSYLR